MPLTKHRTLIGSNPKVVPLGLVSTAIGGSMIEEWVPNTTIDNCKNVSIAGHNQMLYDEKVLPYLEMTVKGWLWYQVSLLRATVRSPRPLPEPNLGS